MPARYSTCISPAARLVRARPELQAKSGPSLAQACDARCNQQPIFLTLSSEKITPSVSE
jgi:hypothetical protein